MLLIHCPYCEEMREEEEFSPAGQAHIERPLQPEEISDEQWAHYLFFRKTHAAYITRCGYTPPVVVNILTRPEIPRPMKSWKLTKWVNPVLPLVKRANHEPS